MGYGAKLDLTDEISEVGMHFGPLINKRPRLLSGLWFLHIDKHYVAIARDSTTQRMPRKQYLQNRCCNALLHDFVHFDKLPESVPWRCKGWFMCTTHQFQQ